MKNRPIAPNINCMYYMAQHILPMCDCVLNNFCVLSNFRLVNNKQKPA